MALHTSRDSDTSSSDAACLGYKRHAVDQLLEEVADSFEDVWRERGELADSVEQLETRARPLKRARRRCCARRSSPPSARRSELRGAGRDARPR